MKRINTLTFIIIILNLFTQDAFAQKMSQENLMGSGSSFSESSNLVFENEKISQTEDQSNLTVSEVFEPENPIYLLGDATTVGWDNNNALEMEHTGDGVFEIVADIVEGPYIKFISVLGQWTPQWGTDSLGTSESGTLVYQASDSDPDVDIAIPAPVPGQYLIQADTVNLTYTITSLQNSIYLLGDATTVGWDNNNALEMEHTGAGVFEIVADIIEGPYIKFISVLGQWTPQWGTDSLGTSESGTLVYQASDSDPDAEIAIPAPVPGQYLIQADTVNLTYTITPLQNPIYLLGDATTVGWDNNNALEMEHIGDGVFEILADIIDGPYIKFISVLGQWAPQWGTNETGTSMSGPLVYRPTLDDPDPATIPAPAPGQYLIQADTVNLIYNIVPLFDTFTLTFNVSNENGIAVDDANIMLHGSTIFEPGVYVFEGLNQGNISYTIWRTGYANQSGNVNIVEDTDVNITLTSLPSGNTSVYLLGNATSAGWNNQAALPMNHLGNGVFEIYTEIIDAEGYIKFISEPGQWAPQWGTNENGTSTGGQLIYRGVEIVPDPMPIPAPAEGLYRILADVLNLEYSIEPYLPKITFIVLDVNNDPIPDARILLNGQQYSEGEYIFEGLEAGSYYYAIWKEGMTVAQNMAVIESEDIIITEILYLIPAEEYRFYILGDATIAGWDNLAAIEMQSLGEGVFQTDVEIIQGIYIKFIAVAGQWTPQWGTNANGTSSSGELIYQPDPFSPIPDAIPAPSPGFYRILADTMNNTYSVTELETGIITPTEDLVALYPNPASDYLYVESSYAISSIVILDNNGKIVYQKEAPFKSTSIALSGLRPGVYIVHIYSQNKVTTKKLVIDR